MIVVDTSVWIDFLGGESREGKALHRLLEDEEDISLTQIILTEILQGIKKEKDFQAIKDYLIEFPIIKSNGTETYVTAARIYRDCRKKGKTVRKTVDCIIAAICIESGYYLLHRDKDFNSIEACTSLKIFKV